MATKQKSRWFIAAGAGLAMVCAAGAVAQSQSAGITITVAGQSMIRSDIRATKPSAVPVIRGLLKGDVVFSNLESTVAEKGETMRQGSGLITPPEALDALQTFGFNMLALAGNHAFDLNATGIRNTIREADRRKITHAGTGENLAQASAPGYMKTPQGTIALVASASGLLVPGANATADRPGVNELRIEAGDKQNTGSVDLSGAPPNTPNPEDAQRTLQSIREARAHADYVVVYQHNHVFGSRPSVGTAGAQERLAPNEWLVKWTHQEIDAGADLIVMHGEPLVHGVEIYHGRPIFYDMGNFIFNLPAPRGQQPLNWDGVVASARFEGKNLRSISFRPIVLNDVGEGVPDLKDEYDNNQYLDTRGLPAPATGAKAQSILQRLVDASKPFGTTVEVKGETAEIVIKAK